MLHLLRCAALATAVCCADTACAAIIVQWDFTGDSGIDALKSSTANHANVSGLDFSRGAGLNPQFLSDTFNSTGWGSTDATDYVEFGFSVAPGSIVQLTDLQIATEGAGFHPGTLGLFYSGDGFAAPLLTFIQPFDVPISTTVDLSGLGSLSGTTRFRLMEMGNASPFFGQPTDDFAYLSIRNNLNGSPVTFNGSVLSSVPEPSAILPLCVAGIFLATRRNRRPYKKTK